MRNPDIKIERGEDFLVPGEPSYMIVLHGNSCVTGQGWGLAMFILTQFPFVHFCWARNCDYNAGRSPR